MNEVDEGGYDHRMQKSQGIVTLIVDGAVALFGSALVAAFQTFGLKPVYSAGRLAARIIYAADKRKREITRSELAFLFPDKTGPELDALTFRSFENHYKRHFETVFFGRMDQGLLDKAAEARGIEHIDEALSKGKGVIMLLSHFGSFLIPLPYLGFKGYRVNQITGKQIHKSLVAERIWLWRKKEADRLPVGFRQVDKFLRPVYQALKNNEIVAIAFDGRDSTHWSVVDFFGKKARFSTGPFELARRTGAAIIPTFVIRKKDDRHRIIFEPPFRLSEDPDLSAALDEDTSNFAEIFSRYVSDYPCHFGMVLYKLKCLPPDSENAFYVGRN